MNLLDARRLLHDLAVVHVGTIRPDGTPHVVPLWFVWRDEGIYVSCRQNSAAWRNAERDPHVALSFQLGRRWQELAGAVVGGRAEPLVPEHPALRGVMSAWFEKYRPLLVGGGFRDFAEQIERPGILRVRPERVAAWNHAAGLHRRAAPG